MIASWPWGSQAYEPDFDAFESYIPPDLTVHPTECDDEPALLDSKGNPIRWVPRHPVGFTLPPKP